VSGPDGGIPPYDALPRDAAGAPVGWGVFGAGDRVGRMNLQSGAAVAAAAHAVVRGAVFPLNAPQDLFDPPLFGRGAIRHTRLPSPGGTGFDDVYDNYYPQASSQWDALSHVAYAPDVFYQGVSAEDVAQRGRNGIEVWAQRGIAGRGVLLDVARAMAAAGRPFDPGSSTALTVEDLELARAEAGVEFRLDALAADCAADARYEFLLTSAPLHVPGGIGSPANALAIK
jgi:hypothetical protein